MSGQNAASVAQKVREVLQARRPGGMDLEVVEDRVHKVDSWWYVPVRPMQSPANLFQYYEELADVEAELQDEQNLNIVIATGEAPEDAAETGRPHALAPTS